MQILLLLYKCYYCVLNENNSIVPTTIWQRRLERRCYSAVKRQQVCWCDSKNRQANSSNERVAVNANKHQSTLVKSIIAVHPTPYIRQLAATICKWIVWLKFDPVERFKQDARLWQTTDRQTNIHKHTIMMLICSILNIVLVFCL